MLTTEKSGPCENLWRRPETHILAAGIGSLLMYAIWVGFSALRFTPYCGKLLSLTATRFLVGRPGGVYFGHVLELDYGTNIIVNMLVDAVAVLLLYPLFVFTIENIVVSHPLKNFIGRIHQTARTNYKIIKRYGVPALFFFVLFPLWGTGPVVGCMIGFMMGLRPWSNMGIVLSATFLAIIIWAVILAEFHIWLLAYGPYMPMVVVGIFFVGTIGVHMMRAVRRKEKNEEKDAPLA